MTDLELPALRLAAFRRQMLCRPKGGLGSIGNADLAQNCFDVNLDGGLSNIKAFLQ